MYLSSFRIGDAVEKFEEFFRDKKTALISNATDWKKNEEERAQKVQAEMEAFAVHGCSLEDLDLRKYFGKSEELKRHFAAYDAVWIRGGNTFTLRQAMALSGFDTLLLEKNNDPDFVYGGYSAGICILSPDLKGIELADDPYAQTYEGAKVLWDGLGIVDYSFCPHYKSDHPESADVEKCVQYCIDNKVLFKALRDGEVIIIE